MSNLERVNITLPGDLKREARAKAIREGKNLSLVVRELLRGYVGQDMAEPIREAEESDNGQ
jgi:hypothetical protein